MRCLSREHGAIREPGGGQETGPDEETNALVHGVGRGILQVKRNVTSPKDK